MTATAHQHIHAFLAELQPRFPQWTGDYRELHPADCHALVQALVRDFLDDHGQGHDWGLAGDRAQFIMASIFHDRYPLHHESPLLPELSVGLNHPQEGFGVHLRRPSETALPPVPNLGGGGASVFSTSADSFVSASAAQLPPQVNIDAVPLEIVVNVVHQVGDQFASQDRQVFEFAAAFFVAWRGYQARQWVRGGAVFRDIHNPQQPEGRRGDVRIQQERTGGPAEQALAASPDGGIVVLL